MGRASTTRRPLVYINRRFNNFFTALLTKNKQTEKHDISRKVYTKAQCRILIFFLKLCIENMLIFKIRQIFYRLRFCRNK